MHVDNDKNNSNIKTNNLDEILSIPDENKEKFSVYVEKFPKNTSICEKNLEELKNISQKSIKRKLSIENNTSSENHGKNALKDREIEIKGRFTTDKVNSKTFKSVDINKKVLILPTEKQVMIEIESREKKRSKLKSLRLNRSFFQLDFEKSFDENGKLKENFRNIFWPSNSVKTLYKFIEKRSGVDSTLEYCSQIEKIKKFLFHTKEEINLLNNLPDLDVEEIMEGNEKSEEHLKNLILKIKEKNPNTKFIKMIKHI